MYLKSIKSHGFKSFADVTQIDLKEGITGIVGPNGSGKSNIVDAVKWVLGEQSLKALRGSQAMSDVIFAGSKSRNPLNRAYVSLVFDNSDKYLNTEFATLEIKRVLYKSGENEYFINNAKVRLKDITDLFIDSGAGKESFNIISQGTVADIINNKPEDRRVIFESASGVLKYKKRKEETNRKLLKVKDNLEKIELIINELKDNRDNLEHQAIIAQKYLQQKQDLEKLEIALIAEEITNHNNNYLKLKQEVENLNTSIEQISFTSDKDTSLIENLKLENIKLDEQINSLNEQILNLNKEISMLNSEKQVTIERQKYQVEDAKLQTNIVNLKEEELTLNKNIKTLEKEIEIFKENKDKEEKEYQDILKIYQNISNENNSLNNTLLTLEKECLMLNNQIEILEDNLKQNEKVPLAIKAVLGNLRLKGIHNIIGNLIEVDSKFAQAIDTALGYSANIIVVDNEKTAKEAINYLKMQKLGRATFFPLNIIQGKSINQNELDNLKEVEGFVGIAANLVSYNEKYQNIIANQLGNVLVVDNIDTLNKVGKLLKYRYRVVSLDGEILHTGGALTGGATKSNSNSLIMLKEKLNTLKNQKQIKDNEKENIKNKLIEITQNTNLNLTKLQQEKEKLNNILENINQKNLTLNELKERYQTKIKELEGTKNLQENKLDAKLQEILEAYYQKNGEKESLEKELDNLKNQKNETFLKLNDLEKEKSAKNSNYNELMKQLKNKEVELGKLDVLLDNLLNTLNETYNMTYEKAARDYPLEVNKNEAKQQISLFKKEIEKYGEVNTGAIAEFARVEERYTFLTKQKADLENSIVSLNEVIDQMDNIMVTRFTQTFQKIQQEFKEVFKKLFKGGEGTLKLTDPDNILETGIEIIAQPPGKKLNSIGLLSGGEKTLTAISLLFAILNVNPVPFVILDEVEAALDEANVEMFGKYLLEKKDKSQFIIITHKKKTMEYADVLYGITMQESGISKLVSVKLENL